MFTYLRNTACRRDRTPRRTESVLLWTSLFAVALLGPLASETVASPAQSTDPRPSAEQTDPRPSAEQDEAKAPPGGAAAAPELPDSTWRALLGADVEVTRDGGVRLQGQLIDADATAVTIVQADGTVIAVSRTDIVSLRRVSPASDDRARHQPSRRRAPMSEHTGLYLSGATGFGMPLYWTPYEGINEPYDGTERVRAPGYSVGLAIGGAPRPGVVLGFSLDSTLGPATYEDDYDGRDNVPDGFIERDGNGYSVGASFFVQGYIRNFFMRGGLGGMGLFYIDDGSSDDNLAGGGMGVDFTAGAHFPVARKAAIGFSAGLRTAFWSYDNDEYRGKERLLQPMLRLEAVMF